MHIIQDVFNLINEIAPFNLQEQWDNSGLLIGAMDDKVSNVLICLDVTDDVVNEAIDKKCELIISHHPIIFTPLKSISSKSIYAKLIKNDIGVISAHTNYDIANGGINDVIVEKLNAQIIQNYIEQMYDNSIGLGKIAKLDKEYSANELAQKLKSIFGNTVIRYNETDKKINTVAICSGSGGSLLPMVLSEKVDAFITGDVKHDQFIDAQREGLIIFDAGHFHTENIALNSLMEKLSEKITTIKFTVADNSRDILSYK